MARKSRTAVLKRQREAKKAEKAAAKREKREMRESSEEPRIATNDDLAGYGLAEDEDEGASEESEERRASPSAASGVRALADEPLIAVFVDYENLAIGVRRMRKGKFQIDLVLRRLLEKGRIIFKRAYCDWGNYRDAVRDFHGHGIEMVDIPQSKASGKNSADIHMVVDALDLCYQKGHIDLFALLSGDSDFSPLVAKLKENDKRVIGVGVKSSTSDLLIGSCDEFIYYDDLIRESAAKPKPAASKKKIEPAAQRKEEATERMVEVVRSLERDYDTVWGSMVKQAIRRLYPGFNEVYYGHESFADLLEAVEKDGGIDLEYDERRGNYIVRTRRR
jgi:uncharacterized protein (TIGR00288 family)